MRVFRRAWGLEVWTPAKLNLFLEVLSRRPDGYHEIETFVVPISLYDSLAFREDSSGRLELFCHSPLPDAELPAAQDNLVLRALELLRERYGAAQGMSVRLHKRIPLAAGLAGGSSDAAAALVAANELWKLKRPRAELAELAAEIGSDVPLFFEEGAVLCWGRGEQTRSIPNLGPLDFVVACPAEGLSTAEVYAACRPAANPRGAGLLVDALSRGNLALGGQQMANSLQEAAETISPRIAQLKTVFDGLDVPGHQMSGSGSSYFALCRNAAHARRVAARVRAVRPGHVFCVRSCS